MSRVGIFGGSFNPPHIGHQALCSMLLESGEVDEVWMVPTYRHVFSKQLLPFEERVAMCERCLEPLGARARVCRVEQELGGEQSRMLDTLSELGRRHPDHRFRLVVGADILLETDRWYRWEEVARLAPPLVFERRGYEGGELPAPPEISSTEIRERLGRGESALPLVPKAVMDYIAERGLYLDRKNA